jgi:acyl-CoA synthetase (AMP-forming)/AMP-acid ligase II/thioesterase domain-containing protein
MPPTSHRQLAFREGLPLELHGPETLAAVLRSAAEGSAGITYIQGDGSDRFHSYRALLQQAERICSGLRREALKPGDKVIFQLDDRSDFIHVLWACFIGGFVAVPVGANAKFPNVVDSLGGGLVVSASGAQKNLGAVSVDELRAESVFCETPVTDPNALALVNMTSGSSGTPKFVMHSQRGLVSSARAAIEYNKYSAHDITLNWIPLDHVSGLLFHIRDVCLGCSQVHGPLKRVLEDPLVWLDWIDRYRANVTSAPHFAYAMLASKEIEIAARRWDLSCMWVMLNGGEPIIAQQARRFLHLLAPQGLADTTIRPAWGMSETASGVVYADHLLAGAPEQEQCVCVGRPVRGFALRIVDECGRLVEEGVVGNLEVRGPSVMLGYFGAVNDQPFTEDGWLKTGDLGLLRDGSLTITGRKKEILIVNGVNYSPLEIETLAAKAEAVSTSYVAAFPVRRVEEPTDRLAVLFHTDSEDPMTVASEIRQQIVQGCGLNPALVLPVSRERIRKSPLAKIQRGRLRSDLESGAFDDVLGGVFAKKISCRASGKPDPRSVAESDHGGKSFVMPRDMMEAHLAEIWEDLLKIRPIGIKNNFFQMGGESVLAARLFHQIEVAFGKSLPVTTIFATPTIEGLAEILKQEGQNTGSSSLVPLQAAGEKHPFFCVCGLGSYVFYYMPLALHLGRARPVYGLQTQIDANKPAAMSIREIAAGYVREIRVLQPRGPYLLGGHSAGGTVAFEMSQQLRTAGEDVALLALFDTLYPGYLRSRPSRYTTRAWMQKASYRLGRFLGLKRDSSDGPGGVRNAEPQANGSHSLIPRRLPDSFRTLWQLDRQAIMNYAPSPYPGRVVVFRARDSRRELYVDHDLGWSQIVESKVETHVVKGGHVTLLERPYVGHPASELSRLLDEVDEQESSQTTRSRP